ncbi:MAG: PilZ domain-containing protein [Acidobacteriota bacterium]
MSEFSTRTQNVNPVAEFIPEENYLNTLHNRLEQIQQASTHYQTLMLEPAASYEDIVRAYTNILHILYPASHLRDALSHHSIFEVEKAFRKVSLAFSFLVEPGKRAEYDTVLSTLQSPSEALTEPASASLASTDHSLLTEEHNVALRTADSGKLQKNHSQRTGSSEALSPGKHSDAAPSTAGSNRRRNQRSPISVTVQVTGYGRNKVKWVEQTQSLDVSRTGLSVALHKPIRTGTILHITMPVLEKFRPQGYTGAELSLYVLVRRIEPAKKGIRTVALEFIGNQPPPGFNERPWAVFKPRSWAGLERRRTPRLNRQERVRLEYYNEGFELVMKEDTSTEDVSTTGMRILARFVPDEFEFVKVNCLDRDFHCLAVVRARFLEKDGLERLSIQFLNKAKSRLGA